jgi:hypothetical protein
MRARALCLSRARALTSISSRRGFYFYFTTRGVPLDFSEPLQNKSLILLPRVSSIFLQICHSDCESL